MKSIQTRILRSFCILGLISLTAVGAVVSWKLRQSISHQSERLMAEMTSQTYNTLQGHHEALLHHLKADLHRSIARIDDSPIVRENLDNGNRTQLCDFLERTIYAEGIDYALLFSPEMQLQASFPRNFNELIVENYFAASPLGIQVQQALDGETAHTERTWRTVSEFKEEELKMLRLDEREFPNNRAISIANAGILENNFGDPIGVYIVGKFLNQDTQALAHIYEITGTVGIIYQDTIPIAQAGIINPDQERFALTSLQISPETRTDIYRASKPVNITLQLDRTTYLATCSSLKSSDQKNIGAICVGIPEANILKTQHIITASGQETQKQVQEWILSIAAISLGLFALLSVLIAKNLVKPLKDLSTLANEIALGNVQQVISIDSQDELGQLSISLNKVVDAFDEITETAKAISVGDFNRKVYLRSHQDELGYALQSMSSYLYEISSAAAAIAEGNLHQDIQPKSNTDALSHSLQKMIHYLQDVAEVAEKISNDNLDVDIAPRSAQDILNRSLQQMVANLQESKIVVEKSIREIEHQNWFKTGQAELSNRMRGEQTSIVLAQNVITYLATYLHAQIGAIYLARDDQTLQLAGSYAYATRKGNRNVFKLGEGLVGQAALEKNKILFRDIPDDYLAIASGLGETAPRNILVVPFLYDDQVKGLIELGTVQEFNATQQEFLEQVLENIAIAFNSCQVREQMQALLETTQQQAQELQAQQEKLRVTNEELESQAKALRKSEQKLQHQQEELRQTNEELGEQTKALEQQQKTLRVKNEELEIARKLVEEKAKDLEITSRYKSEFLANMSHELRTPLNSLLILSKLLSENKERNLNDKQIEYVKTIHAAGSELLALINEVLDLSKVEAGKMEINLDAMSLKGVLTYIEQNFGPVMDKKGLTLTTQLAEELPASIHTDRQRVEQILKNLMSNAVKFTSQGGIRVSITRPAAGTRFKRDDLQPATTVAIIVSDSGIGIPQAKQRTIFEAFQQADGTTSRKYGGTGLGLSIVREFANLLGGEVQLESEEQQGSTFTLYLPEHLDPKPLPEEPDNMSREPRALFATDDPYRQGESEASSMPPAAHPDPGVEMIRDDRHGEVSSQDKFLLIIEDDPKFAKILFDLARERGFKGLIAGDGAAGLQLAYQYMPHAIILDVGLPSMDGWTVMQKLKKNPDTRHVPVHFISGQDDSLKALKMGAIGYLIKPVDIDELDEAFSTIEETISKTIRKLLIVEDDNIMRKSMLELLGGKDVDITTAKSGEEAYHLLQTEPFDCMVLDLGLGDISGFELLEKIKADPVLESFPIIIYTGKELTKDEELHLKQYAESVIIKGVRSPERLLDEVTLFLHRIEANLPEAQQRKLRILHDKELALKSKRILMVDDDMRNVFALSNVLEEKGMDVLIAENGKEGVRLLDENPDIQLVLMDIMMPEMDGYEAIACIREQPRFSSLPIIALTAKAMKGDRQKCIEVGANDYLSKPIDIDKLLSLLRVWLY